jgi:hypothetical protein
MKRAVMIAAGLSALGVLVACNGMGSGGKPETTAPDFDVITDAQLKSTMWQFAHGVRTLQTILGEDGTVDREQQAEVLHVLEQMIAAADALGPEPVATGHPRVEHNIARFREKLVIARNSAAMVPPRYYLVGNISGTCLACHGGD